LPCLTRRVNCVTLTPPPANVSINFTQGRKHFEYYLVVAFSWLLLFFEHNWTKLA
jgi:hypothetical protein